LGAGNGNGQSNDVRGSDKSCGHFQIVPEDQIRVRVGPETEIERCMTSAMTGNGKSRLGLGLGLDLGSVILPPIKLTVIADYVMPD